ncbi:Proteasome subunit alpha type-4 [Smittium mucronatum]|uniref:Proteasome subunit alpha type n=1 Tax=Smittium mucronatum TaxID=133383 RepID=A0A1R0GNA8_9FUNG|nr:Proteasome subunit alpha type-4 [Smittium mucronatum]
MARRYDSRTTIFSPDGRLYQVEYAMEAINHAGTVVGVLASDGIILCAEKQQTSKLLDKSLEGEKIYEINSNIISGVAGITSDANLLVNEGRMIAQQYLYKYDSDIPVEQLVRRICDIKQGYTQFGGLRPFGTSFLIAGWDPIIGFQLYQTDPAGNYSGWKAACIGENNGSAQSLLKQEYKSDDDTPLSMDSAFELICKVIGKTIDSSKLTSDNLEFSSLTLVDGVPKVSMFSTTQVDDLLKKYSVENTA